MKWRRAGGPLLALLLAACAGAPGPRSRIVYETGSRAAVTQDGLHRVKARRSGAVYVRPGARLIGYRKLVIAPAEVIYREEPRDPRGFAGSNVELEPHELRSLQGMLAAELSRALESTAGFELAEERAADALLVRAGIIDLQIDTPRRKGGGRAAAAISGSFTLMLDVSDSLTGVSLLRMLDARALKPSEFSTSSPDFNQPTGFGSGFVESAAMRRAVGNRSRALSEAIEELWLAGTVPAPRMPVPGS